MGFSGTSYPHSLCWLLIFKVVGLWGWRNGSAHWCLLQRTWVWLPSLTWHSRLVSSPGSSEVRHVQGTLCTCRHHTHYSDTQNKNESFKNVGLFVWRVLYIFQREGLYQTHILQIFPSFCACLLERLLLHVMYHDMSGGGGITCRSEFSSSASGDGEHGDRMQGIRLPHR